MNSPPARATSTGPAPGRTAAAASRTCVAACRRMPAATGSAAGAARHVRREGRQHGRPVRHAGTAGPAGLAAGPNRSCARGQQRGRAAGPAVVGAQRRVQAGPADPGAAAHVAQQMAPAVRPPPAAAVGRGAERDHAGAGGDDHAGTQAERARVRRHRVARERESRALPGRRRARRGQPGAQIVAEEAMPAAPTQAAAIRSRPGSSIRPCASGRTRPSRLPASMPCSPVTAGRSRGGGRRPGGRRRRAPGPPARRSRRSRRRAPSASGAGSAEPCRCAAAGPRISRVRASPA